MLPSAIFLAFVQLGVSSQTLDDKIKEIDAYANTVLQTWHGTMLKRLALDRGGRGLRTKIAILRERARWDADERWHKFTWTTTARAVKAELDPQRLHYLDVSKLDDARTLEPDASASHRWGLEFAAVAEYLLSLIATL